jgi:hypothetical protein
MEKIRKVLVVLFSIVFWGGYITSCSLEASVESPSDKPVELPKGMPKEVHVYGPSIIRDGTITTLTYSVKVDWPPEGPNTIAYTAQNNVPKDSAPNTPVDALILHYGMKPSPSYRINLLSDNGGRVSTDATYTLESILTEGGTGSEQFVILPLDTVIIKKELLKKFLPPAGTESAVDLLIIEENKAGIKLEFGSAGANGPWEDGTYASVQEGIRIMGVDMDREGSISCNIGDLDDVKKTHPTFIGTVLLAGEESVINFYAGDKAGSFLDSGSVSTADSVSKNNTSPDLRVVYRWAD